ncbi:MAG: 4-vinyl reductase [Hungatella sp.]|jgi:predicted hydrocarbon binding protein|nr:4-vinyl reductase [Hungatella sp.]
MFNTFQTGEESNFSWNMIGNIAEGRKNLGEEMPVMMYRLFQYSLRSELSRRLGGEMARELFRSAGEVSGREFALHMLDLTLPPNDFLASLQKILEVHKIGILRIEKFDPHTGYVVLTVGEDLDCSGLPVRGDQVCNYDEGFLSGVLKEYTGKEYVVKEVDCWASGSRVCRFEASVDHRTKV